MFRKGRAKHEVGFASYTWTICPLCSVVKIILANCRHAESTFQNCCTPNSHPNGRVMTKLCIHLCGQTSPPLLELTLHLQNMYRKRLRRKPPNFFRCWKVGLEKTVFPTICYSCSASVKCQNKVVLKMLLSKIKGGRK